MFLLVVVLCFLPAPGFGQIGAISFELEQLIVDEGSSRFTTVQIPLVREGGSSGAVVVTITVSRLALHSQKVPCLCNLSGRNHVEVALLM